MNKTIALICILSICIVILIGCTKVQTTQREAPKNFELQEKYPNPFCPNTTISYSIPDSCHVLLIVYNVLGKIVDTAENKFQPPGEYTVEWDAVGLNSGVYFYKLIAGDFTDTRKMVLLR